MYMENPNILRQNIEKIKKVVADIKTTITDNYKVELKFLELEPELYERHLLVVKMIIKSTDLTMLDKMLDSLTNIHNNPSSKDEELLKIAKELDTKYNK